MFKELPESEQLIVGKSFPELCIFSDLRVTNMQAVSLFLQATVFFLVFNLALTFYPENTTLARKNKLSFLMKLIFFLHEILSK